MERPEDAASLALRPACLELGLTSLGVERRATIGVTALEQLVELNAISLADLSDLEPAFFTRVARSTPGRPILIVKFSGVYRNGSEGDSDARFMYAMTAAGIGAWNPTGVVLDLTELGYSGGAEMASVLDVGDNAKSQVPVAVLVGPKSDEGIRRLLLGGQATSPLESTDLAFRRLEDACDHVDTGFDLW